MSESDVIHFTLEGLSIEMKKVACCITLLMFLVKTSFAGQYFDFSPRAKDAYQKIFTLRFEAAGQDLITLQQQEPDNLIRVFLENYLEVLRIGIDDDEAAYNRLSGIMDKRLDQLSRGEPRSPYYRYTQAEIRLQWAVLRARFGDYLACLSDVKLAYALLEENDRRFPDFIANKKSLGILHALVGNVPDDYRWAVRMLSGMSGSIAQGLGELDAVLNHAKTTGFQFEEETLIAYGILQNQLNNQGEMAWKTLKNSKLSYPGNPLGHFALASLALRTGRTDEAIQLLKETPAGKARHPFYYHDFLLGIAKLYRLDADADQPLQYFVEHFKGENGVKEAWQKLGWHQLLQGNTAGYYTKMWNVKHQGAARSEPDKAAAREADSGDIPDQRLLKARLLFDGGYYARAYDLLKNNGVDYAANARNNLEYYYRLARITHQMGQWQTAAGYYERTVESGEKMPWYFACNAALQMGLLHEEKLEVQHAKYWYQKCLSIHPDAYAGSLHAKAKAGLNRIHE